MLISSRENVILDTVADANGNFIFKDLDLSDTAKIVLQARKRNDGKNVAIYVRQPDFPDVSKSLNLFTGGKQLNAEELAVMKSNFEAFQKQLHDDSLKSGATLRGVTIRGKRYAKPDIYNQNGTLPEQDIDLKKIQDYYDMRQAIKYGLPFVDFYRRKYGVKTIIDGLDIDFTGADINSYEPSEVTSIRFIDAAAYNEDNPGTGRPAYLVITTKLSTDTTVLKQVDIKATKVKKSTVTRSSNLHGPGNADQVIMGDKLGSCVSLADCLRGKVFGVSFAADGSPINISRGANSPMVIIVEGNQLAGSELNNIDVNTVSSIEVLRTNFAKSIYGGSIGGGALIITLKDGSEKYTTSTVPAGLITYPFKGFYKARQFYSPKYAGPKQTGDAPDLRSTIYWQPNVITDKDGKTSFEYFNADTKGTYRITLEGIDENGQIGRAVYRYKVQ
jgi:hypothetical protein